MIWLAVRPPAGIGMQRCIVAVRRMSSATAFAD
jgi:hypothetical protein